MATDKWATPQYVFDYLNERFGPFDMDAAAADDTAKCEDYFTLEDAALTQPWFGRVFVNPPYGNIGPWVNKAEEETKAGRADLVLMLLPPRTDQRWWQEGVTVSATNVYFIKGRIAFELPGKSNCSFEPSIVVVFSGRFPAGPVYRTMEIPKPARVV